MKGLMIGSVLLAFLQMNNGRNFENISEDTPEVILDNILDAKMCARQVGVDVNSPQLSVTDKDGIFPEDNQLFNLFYGCIFKRKGIVNDDGQINVEYLDRYLRDLFTLNQAISPKQRKLIDDAIERCKNIKGRDYGDVSVKLNNCIMNELHNVVKE